jgi:hypothetical protein
VAQHWFQIQASSTQNLSESAKPRSFQETMPMSAFGGCGGWLVHDRSMRVVLPYAFAIVSEVKGEEAREPTTLEIC